MQADEFLSVYMPQWKKKRAKAGIKIRGIFADVPKVAKKIRSLPLASYKLVPPALVSPAFWWLQADTIYLFFLPVEPNCDSSQEPGTGKNICALFQNPVGKSMIAPIAFWFRCQLIPANLLRERL